jgi:hypothetical protein
MLKRLSILSAFILVVSTFGAAFHHHDEATSHDDCAICCIAKKNNEAVLTQDNNFVFSANFNNICFKYKDILTQYTLIRILLARAPPS